MLSILYALCNQNSSIQYTLQPLYNMVCYNMVLDITWLKDGSQKYIDYIKKMTINGHFSI